MPFMLSIRSNSKEDEEKLTTSDIGIGTRILECVPAR